MMTLAAASHLARPHTPSRASSPAMPDHGARMVLAIALVVAGAATLAHAASADALTSHLTAFARRATKDPLVDRALEAALALERRVDAMFAKVWRVVLDNFHPFVIAGPLTFAYHEAVYFGAWTPWLAMDQFEYFKRWKIQPDKTPSKEMVMKCLTKLLKSHVFIQLPMQMMFYFVAPYFGFSLAMEALPKSRDLLWQIPVFFAIEDFYFYWVHRGLHHKRVYKYVHKIHHEHKFPFGIAAEYAHPVETFFLGHRHVARAVVFRQAHGDAVGLVVFQARGNGGGSLWLRRAVESHKFDSVLGVARCTTISITRRSKGRTRAFSRGATGCLARIRNLESINSSLEVGVSLWRTQPCSEARRTSAPCRPRRWIRFNLIATTRCFVLERILSVDINKNFRFVSSLKFVLGRRLIGSLLVLCLALNLLFFRGLIRIGSSGDVLRGRLVCRRVRIRCVRDRFVRIRCVRFRLVLLNLWRFRLGLFLQLAELGLNAVVG